MANLTFLSPILLNKHSKKTWPAEITESRVPADPRPCKYSLGYRDTLEQPVGLGVPHSCRKVFLFASRARTTCFTINQTVIAVWIEFYHVVLISSLRHCLLKAGNSLRDRKKCVFTSPER